MEEALTRARVLSLSCPPTLALSAAMVAIAFALSCSKSRKTDPALKLGREIIRVGALAEASCFGYGWCGGGAGTQARSNRTVGREEAVLDVALALVLVTAPSPAYESLPDQTKMRDH